jgi:hypothetical protein
MCKAVLIAVLFLSACAAATAAPSSGGSSATSSGGGGHGGSSSSGASHGSGASHSGARDSRFNIDGARAGSGFADAAAHTPGVTVTRETIAGRQATVVSYKMSKPLSEAERRHLHRAGFFEGANELNGLDTIFCRDSFFLIQSNVRNCFRLVNSR